MIQFIYTNITIYNTFYFLLESSCSHPYYVERNRNHMYPLYLKIQNRGEKKTTKLKRIQGDIWVC